MSNRILSDIRSRVRTRFEAASSARFADADIRTAINEGIEELSEATRYYERTVSILLKANRTYYDLRGLTPETALSVSAVWHEPGVRWLTPINLSDIGYEEWEESTGNPISWFVRGLWWLGIWPHPASDVDEYLRVYYTAVAPALVDDGDAPDQLPDEFIPALEEYALYELQQWEGETEKALYWWGKYKESERTLEQFGAPGDDCPYWPYREGMMGSPLSFEQILQEVQGGRWGRPDPLRAAIQPQPAPSPTPMPHPDPMEMAARRAKLMQAMGQLSNVANLETELAQKGQDPKPGLIGLLMSLIQ